MKRPSLLLGLALAGCLLAGCGDDPEAPSDPSVEARPERIVSLSPTATEMLFAIGAGDQIVAADSYSNYPDEAPTTELDGFQPNAEAILGYEPDLVVAASDPGQLVRSLSAVDVATLMVPAATSLDDTYTQIEKLGAATGHVGDAAELVSRMRADVDELLTRVPDDGEPLTYFHELDPNLYTVSGSTYLGELYELAGMTSIADEAPDAAGDYPQLSPEYIVRADPDLIFFADGAAGGVTADDIAERPGWDGLTAVREGRVVEVDPDIASRWGPRIVDYLQVIVDARSQVVPVG